MSRQYVAVKFSKTDQRSYTYHNDGEPVEVGDKVEIETRGRKATVDVTHLPEKPPPFATKPIIGKAQPS